MNDTPFNEREYRRKMDIDSVTAQCVQDIDRNRTRHVIVLEAIVRKAVSDAYGFGQMAAFRGVHDADTAAAVLGRAKSYVVRIAKQQNIGEKWGRDWMFRDEDIAELRDYMATDRRRRVNHEH